MLQLLAAVDKFCGFRISCLIMDLLTKPFDAGRFQYLVVERAIGGGGTWDDPKAPGAPEGPDGPAGGGGVGN
nr:hypothetical protein [Tanacetum cinerariifolium]